MSKLSMNLYDLRPADPRRRGLTQAADSLQAPSSTTEQTSPAPASAVAASADAGAAALRREVEAIRAQLEYERQTAQAERVRQSAEENSKREAHRQATHQAEEAARQERERALAAERKHVESLKQQLHEMTAALQAERNTMEVERQALSETRQAIEAERRTLQQEAERLADQTRQARHDRQSLEQALALATEQRQKIDEAARALEAKAEALEQQNQQVDANRDQIQEQQQAMAEARASLTLQREHLDKEQVDFAAQADLLSRRQQELDKLADELAVRQSDVGQRAAEVQHQATRQDAELAKVQATTDSARQAEVLADDAMGALGGPATDAAAEASSAAVSTGDDADLHDLLTNLPLRERVAPRTAGSPRNRILASLATLLLVVGIVVLLVAPELVGLGQAEEPAEGSPQVASVTEVPNNSGLPQDTPVEQPVATEIAPTVETGVELPVGASEELPPAATEIEEAPEVEVIVPPVVTALPALAIPGGVWTYKAPEQLMAGAPSDKLVATRQWAVRELAESIQQVRERYRLLDDAGPQQVVALAFSDSLERELDKYLPPPVEFERTAEGGHVRPAALVFAEFQTPAGRYLLITQALPGSTDDEVRLVPGRPQTYVLVPGAIQEETIVLDGRRRAWPQPN